MFKGKTNGPLPDITSSRRRILRRWGLSKATPSCRANTRCRGEEWLAIAALSLVLAFVGLFSVSFLQGMVGYFVEIRVALEDRDDLTCEVACWGVI